MGLNYSFEFFLVYKFFMNISLSPDEPEICPIFITKRERFPDRIYEDNRCIFYIDCGFLFSEREMENIYKDIVSLLPDVFVTIIIIG